MDKWNTLASDEQIEKVKKALEEKQFDVIVVENASEAKEKVLSLIPKGAEVQDNTSITLEQTGIQDTIRNSGNYKSLHKQGLELDREKEAKKLMELRSLSDYVVGSAQAVTENGQLLIASNSGSNIPTYAYGANHVIFVIGTQKIVKSLDDGMKRIFEHNLSLETVRARKAYGLPDTWESYPSKILIFQKEPVMGRTTVVLVKEVLGY
jgi:L-lactate utilization protein LutC